MGKRDQCLDCNKDKYLDIDSSGFFSNKICVTKNKCNSYLTPDKK